MIIDIILLIIILVWAIFGYRKGFIKQLFTLAGVVLIIFFAAPIADIAQNVLAKEFDLILTGAYVKGGLLAASSALLYILAHVTGKFLHNTLVKGIPVAESTNHVLGATLGITEAVLVIFFVLSLISIGQNKINEYAPEVQSVISQSKAFQICDKNNLLRNYDFFKSDEPSKSSPAQPAAPEQSEQPPVSHPAPIRRTLEHKTLPSSTDSNESPQDPAPRRARNR